MVISKYELGLFVNEQHIDTNLKLKLLEESRYPELTYINILQ